MNRLVITATPLIERWSVTSAVRRDRVQWPPTPDTLFSALVSAAASLGIACHPALRWLETLGNPVIEAGDIVQGQVPPRAEATIVFSPVADRVMWEKAARQARTHNSVGLAQSVSWSWPTTDFTHVAELARIANEVTYIGSSRGPVIARAFTADTTPVQNALVPTEHGPHRIRGIYPGRLDELEAAYQRGERPRPTQTVGYARLDQVRIAPPWGQLVPLRRDRGQPLFIDACVPVAEAVRHAIMQQLPKTAPSTLTGHA
ncbi:MAG: type I-U CRISPR-associated protein Csb2, partial [Hyphomicrobium sp.]